MQIIGRRSSQHLVAAGTDKVLVGFPLPALGSFNSVELDFRITGTPAATHLQAGFFGISAFIIPVPDPDDGSSFDLLWDQLIPKDVELGAGTFDLDTEATDTTPEFEIGTPDPGAVLKLNAMEPLEMFRRREMVTVHGNPLQSDDTYLPMSRIRTGIHRHVEINKPSIIAVGFSSPDVLDTSTSVKVIPSETQWVLLQYMEVTLEQAMMNFIGLTEAGAESPYTESMAFVASLVEDAVFEQTAGAYKAQSWNVFTNATFNISSKGSVDVGVLTSE